tara:strand:+ start:1598 stop:1819 length:222 start_codon:yes stop_codon:yes gene_type:complete
MVSGGSAYIGYQVGLWARDEVRKYGSLRNTMKYTVIEWVVDWAYDYQKERSRQVMTEYEKKLHDSLYSKELPF